MPKKTLRRTPRHFVVQYSGGKGSWMAARRIADRYGPERMTLLFADTKMEDEDTYRFLEESAADVGAPLVKIADGRDIWEVFADRKFLGNSRVDPCSEELKRNFLRRYLDEHFDPDHTVIVLGIDWSEEHRFKRAQPRWAPYSVIAPLCQRPYLDKADIDAEMARRGIRNQRLYELGFPHANCGGGCVKAGMAHFKLFYEKLPERYAEWEAREQGMRDLLGKDIAILTDRTGGGRRPLTLREFRERLEAEKIEVDPHDLGGCGCVA